MINASTESIPKPSWIRRMLRKLAIGTVLTIAAYPLVALALIFWPASGFRNPAQKIEQPLGEARSENSAKIRERVFVVRDGARIAARIHGADGLPTVLILHGVASEAKDMDEFAALLTQKANVRAVAIDVRGHGKTSGTPWQVQHVGQFDEDISDIVSQIRSEAPDLPLVLAGHSMGGGIATRYSLVTNAAPVDGFLLLSPLLGGDSPSMAKSEAEQPKEQKNLSSVESPVIFRTPRLIGVIMLHSIGITSFDQLPIMLFNHPDRPSYGFAALASMQPNAPSDYRVALRAISKPLILLAGTADEYFEASAFPKIVSENSAGEATLIDGATHAGILEDKRAISEIVRWLNANMLAQPNSI